MLVELLRVLRLFGYAFIAPILLTHVLLAQTDSSNAPQLGLVISTRIDTVESDDLALNRLLGEGRSEELVNSVSHQCRAKITSLLDDHDIAIPIVVGDANLQAHGQVTKWVYLFNTLSVNEWGKYRSQSELVFTDDLLPLPALKQELKVFSTWDEDAIIDTLATSVSREVSRIVANWLVESLYKIRVVVSDFEGSDLDSTHAFLSKGLGSMVESELARNEAFLVYSVGNGLDVNPIYRAYSNYQINGSYFCFEKSVRLDIHCLKTRSGRILLSRSVTLDTLSLSKLSGQMTLAMNRMKKAMLTDGRPGNMTLAVVADPPTQYFLDDGASDDAVDIARLFRRNVANRLRRLVQRQEQSAGVKRLDIHDDTDALDRYLESHHDPGEIISDLAVDYLVLLKIEDLGQRLRVAATMHSYGTDSLIFGDIIYTDDDNKARFRNLIDQTLLKIASTLCGLGLFADPNSIICKPNLDSVEHNLEEEAVSKIKDSLISAINKDTKDVRVLDIRSTKGFGFRIGGIQHHDDRLFLGQGSSEYLEIFYSYLLPHRSWMRSWMALEMEAAVGMDYGGGTLLRRGLTGLQLLLEFRLVITSLQYTDLPITLAIGGGGGIGGISMKYSANEAPYAGLADYEDGVSRGLVSTSTRIEFPIAKGFRLQLLSRWLLQLGSPISRFEDIPFDAAIKYPMGGKLNSRHILVGFKMAFR